MKLYVKKFDSPEINLYPIGDFHIGSEQADMELITKVINMIKDDPVGYWVGMGDFIENAIIGAPGSYDQVIQAGRQQLEYVCSLLRPIAHKGLFLIAGNHETRTYRVSGIFPEQFFSLNLGIPYLGFSAVARIYLKLKNKENFFTMYFHHNYGGSYSLGGKVTKALNLWHLFPTADAIFSAHSHVTGRYPISWYSVKKGRIAKMTTYLYLIGSALNYAGSYAEEKAKPPAVKEFIYVNFKLEAEKDLTKARQSYYIISGA
ncbi:MAG: metallophosphoesterase [Candidatus Omnitrophica bacterium]|nr:metallophosphoesterase [Candidatus Omnitrophota bacterium]